ncbi:MAG: hypothetical protein R3F54_11455 [Alphaproteobacteria bacterium]
MAMIAGKDEETAKAVSFVTGSGAIGRVEGDRVSCLERMPIGWGRYARSILLFSLYFPADQVFPPYQGKLQAVMSFFRKWLSLTKF